MSSTRSDLYRWDRLTKPRVYSRSQRVTTEGDIQDWIKKVELASDQAAKATFGVGQGNVRNHGRNCALATVDDVHIHDAAYAEAQDLLEEWVSNKVDLDVLDVQDSHNWEPQSRPLPSDIKKEWDHLLEDNGLELEEEMSMPNSKHHKDPYSVYEKEADDTMENFVQAMLEKDFFDENFKADISLDSKPKRRDPATKMTLRHQQVKDRRQQRERELAHQREAQKMKKEAEFQARQIIKKEEEAKQRKKKKEEEAIQAEMGRLRKQMAEDRKKKGEEERRQREDKIRLEDNTATQNANDEDWHLDASDELTSQRLQDEKQRRVLYQCQWVETRQATQRLKLLQRCFSGWYNLVVQRHLQAGRARAMDDWRTLLRAWNAWRAYTRSRHLERDARYQQALIQEMTRKEHKAKRHYCHRLLHRCLTAWQLYVTHCQHQREQQQQQHKTHAKMAAFLGKLCEQGAEDDMVENHDSNEQEQKTEPPDSTPGSARSDLSSQSKSNSVSSLKSAQSKMPGKVTDAWLITKKHIDQIKVEKPSNTTLEPKEESKTHGTAWKKAPFVVNNMEHRHKAQQKILETQQNQIKEQQRLIEELQFLQQQQLLQQQLIQQQTQTGKNVPVTTLQTRDQLPDNLEPPQAETNVNKLETGGGLTHRSETTILPLSNRSDASHASNSTVSTTLTKASKSSAKTDTRHEKFVASMAARAEERTRIKAEREARRREAEEAKLAQLQKEAEEAALRDEEVKKKRAAQLREKKRLEKQRQEDRQRHQELLQQQTAQAAEHHRLALMRYRGWIPWQHLMAIAEDKRHKAEMHYRNTLLQKVMLAWNSSVQEELRKKYARADQLHHFLLIRHCFTCWTKVKEVAEIQEAKAVKFHSDQLLSCVLTAWQDFAQEEKMIGWKYERQAREHNTRRIQLRAFQAWRRYPKVLREEEAREKRRAEMRSKVASMLPDFSLS